jgi:putative membrane protein
MYARDSRQRQRRWEAILLLAVLAVFVWSGIRPRERFTWVLETFPVMIALPLLLITYRRFRFTPLTYTLMALHAIVLLVGGRYTYAEVPLFNWLRDTLHLSRNHYDRLGHLMQGLVPAMTARELLLRTSPLKRGKWLFTIVLGLCMGISACYELLEWRVSVATGSAADAFLGTQGDPWDTQEDMAMCGVGALAGLIGLARWQDRELAEHVQSQSRVNG